MNEKDMAPNATDEATKPVANCNNLSLAGLVRHAKSFPVFVYPTGCGYWGISHEDIPRHFATRITSKEHLREFIKGLLYGADEDDGSISKFMMGRDDRDESHVTSEGEGSPDKVVLEFIDKFLFHEGAGNSEVIRHLFHAGYCLYFAIMLQSAFLRGHICLAYPYGHIVWVDTNGIAYDIEGVCTDYKELIPIRYLEETIEDFMHVPGMTAFANPARCKAIYAAYIKNKTAQGEPK